jgi:hypothetical protein
VLNLPARGGRGILLFRGLRLRFGDPNEEPKAVCGYPLADPPPRRGV